MYCSENQDCFYFTLLFIHPVKSGVGDQRNDRSSRLLRQKAAAVDVKEHCSAPPQSISNKKLCWKLQRGMQHWLSQLSPQGGGLSHKLIEHSHMIGEFHLEPSRYIKPYRNEEFTEVPLYFPKSPQITCLIVTLCPLLPHLCTSLLNVQRPAQAHPASISTMHCLLFCPFQSAPYISFCAFVHAWLWITQ